MKTISAPLLALLNASRVRDFPIVMADCFTLTFAAASPVYLTNYDINIDFNGNTFVAGSLLISGLKFKTATGLEVDRQQITLTPSAGSTSTLNGAPWLVAIRDGAFDGAQIQRDRVFIDASLPGGIAGLTLFKGRVATVDKVGRTFAQITVASPLVVLDYYMPRNIFSPTCLHVLYDAGCTLNAASFATNTTVGAGSTQLVINNAAASQNQVQGTMLFTGGLNTGIRATIKSAVNGVSWTLMYPLPIAPTTGDNITAYFGCDHTAATCQSKFSNLVNFRGFPNIPPADYAV